MVKDTEISMAGPSKPAIARATSFNPPISSHTRNRTRFAPSTWSSVWSKVKQQLTPPSHPSTTSESVLGSSAMNRSEYYADSITGYPPHLALELLDPRKGTEGKHKRRRKPSAPATKSSVSKAGSRFGDEEDGNPAEPVSHIVVDNDFDQFSPGVAKSESGYSSRSHGAQTPTMEESGAGGGLFGSRKGSHDSPEPGGDKSEVASVRRPRKWSKIRRSRAYELVFERVWPNIRHFLDSSFPEQSKERSFQKEAWFTQKPGAMVAAGFLLIAWCLTVGLIPQPWNKYNWYAYFGAGGFFILPLPFFVIFDFPRRHQRIWQPWLLGATWVLSDVLVIEMRVCGFFGEVNRCGTRNFINLLGFAYGCPVLALLALRQNRIFAIFGAIQWNVLAGALVSYQPKTPTLFYRNVVTFTIFQAFLIFISFLQERSFRQMFSLRTQLKTQYRATQGAQVLERRAADSKKRFVSYIFHEVRVPLNTALLAVQNLEGEEVFKGLDPDQAEMVHGLSKSLTMMEKVLNDVLSFNRMESGKFTQARKPFDFHQCMQLVALSHRVQAQKAGIELIVDLDKDIDKVGGIFVGDEMRLRQVSSNLVSNAIKFTEAGSVRIVTKLLYPRFEPTPSVELDDPLRQAAINLRHQQELEEQDRQDQSASPIFSSGARISRVLGSADLDNASGYSRTGGSVDLEKGSVQMEDRRRSKDTVRDREDKQGRTAVIRVEIHDTGVGLRKSDVIDNRLFSPYVQTEIGRRQGGKGSGLGLALVRQIIKLFDGRLGVESECGKGSVFWFEIPFALPRPQRAQSYSSPSITRAPTLSPPAFNPPGSTGGGLMSIVEQMQPEGTNGHAGGGHSDRPETRPGMTMTESTMPLLPEAHGQMSPASSRTQGSLPGTWEEIHTYPPPESSTSGMTFTDPFAAAARNGAITPMPSANPRISTESDERKTAVDSDQSETKITRNGGSTKPSNATSSQGPLNALVVDDDRLTRMLMSRMLTRLGHQVTTAENGKVALGMIRDSFLGQPDAPQFEIVFLDNQMPMMTGVEVAREVRQMGCPLFIVGCTGNALREDQDEYISAGADDIIPKPIHQKSVIEMIKEARKRVAGETSPKTLEADE
ncbi:hypothetical protein BCR39DRAFT_488115 [Naematelia encephala]|uniref:histidine kinase n=1 Tax=Naematelia encephala TaxID=71784 RepID=A0A1Y2AHA3_9TREE|nr:hypothetical protein BCR39DRAFT_488115 [Naematelia encephala]